MGVTDPLSTNTVYQSSVQFDTGGAPGPQGSGQVSGQGQSDVASLGGAQPPKISEHPGFPGLGDIPPPPPSHGGWMDPDGLVSLFKNVLAGMMAQMVGLDQERIATQSLMTQVRDMSLDQANAAKDSAMCDAMKEAGQALSSFGKAVSAAATIKQTISNRTNAENQYKPREATEEEKGQPGRSWQDPITKKTYALDTEGKKIYPPNGDKSAQALQEQIFAKHVDLNNAEHPPTGDAAAPPPVQEDPVTLRKEIQDLEGQKAQRINDAVQHADRLTEQYGQVVSGAIDGAAHVWAVTQDTQKAAIEFVRTLLTSNIDTARKSLDSSSSAQKSMQDYFDSLKQVLEQAAQQHTQISRPYNA